MRPTFRARSAKRKETKMGKTAIAIFAAVALQSREPFSWKKSSFEASIIDWDRV
jgi:hypothetical protein